MIDYNDGGQPTQSTRYSWKTGTVNVAGVGGDTDITGISGFAALFTPFAAGTETQKRRPHKIKVETTGAAYISINGGDVITIGATSPFEASNLIVESLSISSGGAAVTVNVYLQ